MTCLKLGFGNRTVLEQIAICRRVAGGIGKLAAEQREALACHPVAESVAEAAQAHTEVEAMKTALKAALFRRQAKVRAMREHTTSAAIRIANDVKGDPAAMLSAGLDVPKDKRPVGQPAAPGQLRVVITDSEGRVCLRWK